MKKILVIIIGLSFSLYAQGITNTLGGNTVNDKFIVENSDSEAGLVITGEGDVGIGTTNPNLKLHVVGNSEQGTPYFTPGTLIALQQNDIGNWAHLAIIAGTAGRASLNFGDVNDDDIGAVRYNNSDNSLHLITNATDQMVITNSGQTGIGTTAPHAKLHVISTTLNGSDNTLKFEALGIGSNASHIHYGTKGDWYIRSAANDGNVIIQDSDGNVGIGTNSPDTKLDVEGTVKVGVNGLVFSEIIELTGTTNSTGNTTSISYPSGYSMNNVRVLALEIYFNSLQWTSNGRVNENTTCLLQTNGIVIAYDFESEYQNKSFRLVLMKIE